MAFLDQAFEHLGAQGGSLVLRSADGSALELIAGKDLPGAKARLLKRVPIEESFSVTEAYRTGRPVAARTHAELRARFPTSARTFGERAQAIYALPLTVHGEAAGAFNLFFDHEHEVGATDADILATMAQLCGQALERALLADAESRARERAEETARYATSLYSLGMRLAGALTPLDVAATVMREAIARARSRRGGCRADRRAAPGGGAACRRRLPAGGPRRPEPVQSRRADPRRGRSAHLLARPGRQPGRAPAAIPAAAESARRRIRRHRLPPAAHRRPHIRCPHPPLHRRARLRLRRASLPPHARGRLLAGARPRASARRDRPAVRARAPHRRDVAGEPSAGRVSPVPELDFAAFFAPMGDGNEVGGDFYDVFPKGSGYTAVVGDVCGKGPEAAKLTALCRYTLRAAGMLADTDPSGTLSLLNRAILEQTPEAQFCTVVIADLDPSAGQTMRATISTSGHPAPLVIRRTGEVEELALLGTVLGVVEEPVLVDEVVELAVGDALMFVTDGVEETRRGDGEFYGHERLRAAIEQASHPPSGATAASLIDAVREDLDEFRGDQPARDDVVTGRALRGALTWPRPVERPLGGRAARALRRPMQDRKLVAVARARLAVSRDEDRSDGLRLGHTLTRVGTAVACLAAGALLMAPAGSGMPARSAGDPSTDKLAQILARGTLILSTDPAYPPQSFRVKGRSGAKSARFEPLPAGYARYDEGSRRMSALMHGTKGHPLHPPLTDAAIGITRERMARLYYTQPYSAEAERFFVQASSPVRPFSNCRARGWAAVAGALPSPTSRERSSCRGEQFVSWLVMRRSSVMTSSATASPRRPWEARRVPVRRSRWAEKAIAEGLRLKAVGGDQYVAYLSGAVDRFSGLHVAAFVAQVNAIVAHLHRQGTLRRLSLKYFRSDFASRASHVDVSSLGQKIT